MRRDLPSGSVTLLFTDIEGSTKLLHELGAGGYSEALAEHRRILREVFGAHGGVEVDTQGDAFDRDSGVPLQLAFDLTRFARVLAHTGAQGADAARLLASAEALREEIGAGTPPRFLTKMIEAALAAIRVELGDATFAKAWEQGHGLTVDEAVGLALGSTSDPKE